MARRSHLRRSRSRNAAWIGAVVVVVLIVVVAILVVVALDRARPAPTNETLAPVPTFGPATPEPSATPTPTAAPITAVPRADERFLSISSEGILWRGIAGSCADESTPLIERSADGGTTWNDVTPLYRGLAQIMRLDAFAGTQAQAVAVLEDGCVTDGLRTFTQGRFWESYEEVLAESAYIAGDDPAQIVTPDGAIAAPCAEARGLRGSGSNLALVCDAQAFALVGDEWQPLGVEGAVAVATDGSTIIVAHAAADCDGIALSTIEGGSAAFSACVEGLNPTEPTTIEISDASVLVWSGTTYTDVSI
ncbi:MAG: hypothetical protein Q7T17_09435 [Microbacterium sp.]|uniref:hypothetical protein n=1 Tax=Microbacterium sp. TaxID=51671 RepID=UPI002725C15C|nr:hypothetical protein [Microbacterium sp.]MDO8383186.1 hypothetical protein [Microbacterium sp.]